MLNIQKQIQVDNSFSLDFEELHIFKGPLGRCFANWSFRKVDSNGDVVGKVSKQYEGDTFVNFWTNFESLKFVYEECLKELNVEDVEVPPSIEDQLNKPVTTPIPDEVGLENNLISN